MSDSAEPPASGSLQSGVHFTLHALERYIERVKPLATTKQARRELEALLHQGEFTTEEPWRRVGGDVDAEKLPKHDGYIILCPGIIAPVVSTANGLLAVTIETNRGISEERRTIRRKAKKTQRGQRRKNVDWHWRKGRKRSKEDRWR